MRLRDLLAFGSIGAIVLIGCDTNRSVTEPEPLEVPVGVAVVVQSLAVAGVSIEVTGPGIETPIVANLPISDGIASGTVLVLAGSDRVFTLRAFDEQGFETHHGADTVNIPGNQTTALNIELAPLVGDVDIGGQVGRYTVTISPATGTLEVGETLQLSAVVSDADGATVPDAVVTWGTSNPARAAVSENGLVEGLFQGEVTIGASYRGFAGAATLVVQ